MERLLAVNFQKASEKARGVWGTDSGRDIFWVEEKTGEGLWLIEAVTRNSVFHAYFSPSLTENCVVSIGRSDVSTLKTLLFVFPPSQFYVC